VLGVHLLHELAKSEAMDGLEQGLLHPSQGIPVASRGEGANCLTSFWRPYLKELPRSYTTLCCFPAEDVSALQVRALLALCI